MPSTLKAHPAPWGEHVGGVRRATPAAGETFKPGDVLIRHTDGTLKIAAASGANAGAGDIVGIALDSAADILTGKYDRSGAGTVGCRYMAWTPGFRAILPLYHATPASAVITEADIDAPTDLELRNQGGIWCLDVASTTNPKFRVESIAPPSAYSETYAYVHCVLLPAADLMDAVA